MSLEAIFACFPHWLRDIQASCRRDNHGYFVNQWSPNSLASRRDRGLSRRCGKRTCALHLPEESHRVPVVSRFLGRIPAHVAVPRWCVRSRPAVRLGAGSRGSAPALLFLPSSWGLESLAPS